MDLAVPRDMEPAIARLEHVRYFDMDSLPVELQSEQMRYQYQQAEEILKEEIQKFEDWQQCRDLAPRIQQIGEDAAKELIWRLEKPLRHLELSEQEKELFQKRVQDTAAKVVGKLLFELRDQAEQETLRRTVEIMENIYKSS